MTSIRSLPLLLLATAALACGDRAADSGAAGEAPAVATGIGSGPAPPASPGPIAEAPAAEQPAAQPYPGMPGATAPAGGLTQPTVLAAQETNWSGVVAEVVEFRRRGNTLTAKVRLRNTSGADARPEVKFDEVYLMDAANARKYEALRDEKGTYIASLSSNWGDRWYKTMEPAEQQTLWIKFPAPPPEVRAITLQLPNMAPFEELAIQDG